jgi:hypothetical protein
MQSLVSLSPAGYPHLIHPQKNPFSAAESAIAIQMEKMRAAEAVAARDVIAQHLSVACKSIRDKTATIDIIRQQNKYLEDILKEHTLAYTPANIATASQSEQPTPAGQEALCAEPIDENSEDERSAQEGPLSSDAITEEEPPKYEVTEAFSQVW